MAAYLLSEQDAKDFRQFQKWKKSVRGPGVKNTPDTLTVLGGLSRGGKTQPTRGPVLIKIDESDTEAGYWLARTINGEYNEVNGSNGDHFTEQGEAFRVREASMGLFVPKGVTYTLQRGTNMTGGQPVAESWFQGPPRFDVFLCDMSQTGGSAGNASTKCSYTYTVTPVHGTLHATVTTTGISADTTGRPDLGAMDAATAGLFYVDQNGAMVCTWSNEALDVEACS